MRWHAHSRPLLALLPLFLLAFTALPTLAQKAEVDCPDGNLTTYLLSLIDTLYANGLTHFESLLAKSSESDEGYDLLSSWYTDDQITLFVPTDAAFQSQGLVPPFDALSDKAIADLVALHTVSGKWNYDALPQSPKKGFADTHLAAKSLMNSTVDSKAMVPLVIQQGDQGTMSIRMASGNATTWGWVIQGEGEVWNVVIIPIDTVLPFPPSLSEVLTQATTSRSTSGLPEFQKALDKAGGAQQLEPLTEGGFTIFAPIDDAFDADIDRALSSEAGVLILGNHYATNYSLFSRIWVDNGPYTMPVISGQELLIQQTDTGATVSMGNQTVRILRSDIVLENGVMHIIEEVLADPALVATAKPTAPKPTASANPTASGTGAGRNPSSENGTVVDDTTGAASPGATTAPIFLALSLFSIVFAIL